MKKILVIEDSKKFNAQLKMLESFSDPGDYLDKVKDLLADYEVEVIEFEAKVLKARAWDELYQLVLSSSCLFPASETVIDHQKIFKHRMEEILIEEKGKVFIVKKPKAEVK